MDEKTVESGDDLFCIACGYNLRELPPEFNCPECGLPIKRSVGGEKLARADPAWLMKIVNGQSLLAWGLVGVLSVLPLFGLFMLSLMASLTQKGNPQWPGIIMIVIGVSLAVLPGIGVLTFLIGSILVTTPSPQSVSEADMVIARYLVRYGILGSLFFGAFYAALAAAPPGTTVLYFLIFTGIAGAGGMAIVIISLLIHLEMLLLQIPDRALSKSIKKVRSFFTWALPLEILLRLLSTIGSVILIPSTIAPITLADVVGCVEIFLGIAILIEIILMMIFMFQARRAFRLCHSIAQDISEEFTGHAD